MHEMSLTRSILDIVEEYELRFQFQQVNSLKLSFGRLACISPGALEFAFEVQSKGTKAQGASLEFDIRPIIIYCFTCSKEIEADSYAAACPCCKGARVVLRGGTEELKLIEMDVD